jgi:hypothetical protein
VVALHVDAWYVGRVTVSEMRVTAATLAKRRPFTFEPAVAVMEAYARMLPMTYMWCMWYNTWV